jgi:hypothetical protein
VAPTNNLIIRFKLDLPRDKRENTATNFTIKIGNGGKPMKHKKIPL